MRPILICQAIILARQSTAEGDLRLQALTQTGRKLQLKVHGLLKSRRRSQRQYTPGNLLNLHYYPASQGPASIEQSSVQKDRSSKLSSYQLLKRAGRLLELSAAFANEEEQEPLFLLLDGSLDHLANPEQGTADPTLIEQQLLDIFFSLRLLKLQGLLGDLQHCSQCGQALGSDLQWLAPIAAFHCTDCAAEPRTENGIYLRLLQQASRSRFQNFVADWQNQNQKQPRFDEWYSMLHQLDQDLLQCLQHAIPWPLKACRN
ncbi:MAG: DNA repair protein RecO [Leptospiraceae bacterium]|nr:DNA repair protein RecO [Leptospiraceae bacterium]